MRGAITLLLVVSTVAVFTVFLRAMVSRGSSFLGHNAIRSLVCGSKIGV